MLERELYVYIAAKLSQESFFFVAIFRSSFDKKPPTRARIRPLSPVKQRKMPRRSRLAFIKITLAVRLKTYASSNETRRDGRRFRGLLSHDVGEVWPRSHRYEGYPRSIMFYASRVEPVLPTFSNGGRPFPRTMSRAATFLLAGPVARKLRSSGSDNALFRRTGGAYGERTLGEAQCKFKAVISASILKRLKTRIWRSQIPRDAIRRA